MAYTIQPRTRAQIRQSIIGLFNGMSNYSVVVAQATSGTTTTVVCARLKAVPQTATNMFNGAMVYVSAGTGNGQTTIVSSFDPTTGTITVPIGGFSIAPDNTSTIELYPKWNKDQVDQAIDLAFLDGSTRLLFPSDLVPYCFESGNATGPHNAPMISARANFRTEYQVPGQFLWLAEVDYDENLPVLQWNQANWTGDAIAIGQTTGNTNPGAQRDQLVQPLGPMNGDTWVRYVSLYLYNPTGLSIALPSMGVSLVDSNNKWVAYSAPRSVTDLDEIPSVVTFTLNRSVKLASGSSYSIQLYAVNSLGNLITVPLVLIPTSPKLEGTSIYWAIDDTAGYGQNCAYIIDNGTQVTDSIKGSYIFYLHGPASFRPFSHPDWSVVQQDSSPQLHFDEGRVIPQDGTLMRIRGARGATDFTSTSASVTDASLPEVEPVFIIYKAASLLCSEKMLAPGSTPELLAQQGQIWAQSAEQHRRPFTLPQGAGIPVR